MSHKIINVLRVEHFKSKKGKAFAKCQIVLYKQDEETKDLVPCGYGFVYVFNEKLLKKIAVGKYCAVFDVFMNYQATLDCQLVDLLDEDTFLSSKNTLPRKELQILSIEENETSTGKTFFSAGLVYLPNDPANVSAGTFTMFDDKDGNNILRDLKPGIYYADFDMRVASYGDNKGMLEPFISNILECKSATNNNNANTSAPKNTNEQKDSNKHKNS